LPPTEKSVYTLIRPGHRTRGYEVGEIDLSTAESFFSDPGGLSTTLSRVLQLPAVRSAIDTIAGSVACLPLQLFTAVGGEPVTQGATKLILTDRPNAEQTPACLMEQLAASLLTHGNAYAQIRRGDDGRPIELLALDPDSVRVARSRTGQLLFRIQDGPTLGPDEMLFVRGSGSPGCILAPSLLEKHRDTWACIVAIEDYVASFFANGAVPTTLIKIPQTVSEEVANTIERRWYQMFRGPKKQHKAHVLSGSAEIKQLSIDPEKTQLESTREFNVREIARIFSMPPSMLGANQTSSFASAEQQNLQFLNHTLNPLLCRIEQAITQQLGDDVIKVRFDRRGLTSLDSAARNALTSVAKQNGIMTVNEIRQQIFGLPRVDNPGADELREQMNLQPVQEGSGAPNNPEDPILQ